MWVERNHSHAIRALLGAGLALALLTTPVPVRADPIDPQKASAARQLGEEGVQDYQAGNYAAASEKLERAYALVPVPTLALWSARALEKRGAWVAASERYLEATRLPLPASQRDNNEQAQKDAAAARDALLPKIPKLTITIEGVSAADVDVSVDGKPMPKELVGIAGPADPGERTVVGKYRTQTRTTKVTLVESGSGVAKLSFEPEAEKASPALPPTASAVEPRAAPPGEGPNAMDRGAARPAPSPLAYVAFGFGAAGILTGGITGFVALKKKNDLEGSPNCRDGACLPPAHSDVDSLDTLRMVSTISFAVGAVGTGVGLALFVSGNSKSEAKRPSTQLMLRPGGVDFRGTF